MSTASVPTKHNVGIDGVGYLIKRGSYNSQVASPFVNQLALNDLTQTDSSLWKFAKQMSWDAGYEKDGLLNEEFTNFYASSNIDIYKRSGKIQLSRRLDALERVSTATDLATTASSAVVTSAGSTFITDLVEAGDDFIIESDADIGVYTVSSVDSETQITLASTLSATDTGVSFSIRRREIALKYTNLSASINSSVTTIAIDASTNIPTSGTVRIENEEITYTGVNGTPALTGCTRGANGTTAIAHYDNAVVKSAETLTANMKEHKGSFFLAAGVNIWSSSDGVTFVVSKNCAAAITDLEESQGVLIGCAGSSGFYYTTNTGSSWTLENGIAATYCTSWKPASTEAAYFTYNDAFKFGTWNGSAWTFTSVDTGLQSGTIYFGKPVIYNLVMYISGIKDSASSGASTLFGYDGFNMVDITSLEFTMAPRMFVYGNYLIFVLQEDSKVTLYAFDGVNIVDFFSLENDSSNTYSALNTHFALSEDVMFFSIQNSNSSNQVYAWDTNGVTKYAEFVSYSSNYLVFGLYSQTLYVAGKTGYLTTLSTTNYEETGSLTSSFLDFNFQSIEKLFQDIEVLHESLPTNTSITVSYALEGGSFTVVGQTNSTASTTHFFAQFPISIKGKKFQYKLTLSTNVIDDTPTIKDVVIRYLLVPHQKRQWNFSALCVDNIRLLDGTEETSSGSDLVEELEFSRQKQDVVKYLDIDYASTTLSDNPLSSSATTINVASASAFPSKGRFRLLDADGVAEEVTYTGTTSTSFTGCTRGANGTEAKSHLNGITVDNSYRVKIVDIHRIEHVIDQAGGLEAVMNVYLTEV